MTSHELAKKLLALPDLMVTVRGYEGGVDTVEYVGSPSPIHINANEAWYYGKHEYHSNDFCGVGGNCESVPSILAIHIG